MPRYHLTRQQVSKRLRISMRAVDRLIATGSLPAVRIGRSVRIEPEAFHALLERHTIEKKEGPPERTFHAVRGGVRGTEYHQ